MKNIKDFITKKNLIIGIAAIIIIVVLIIIFSPRNTDYKKTLQFTQITKGDIKSTISCTGSISAKGTVDIGTQVSGTVSKVFVNYNDIVRKNQRLAQIDITLLQIAKEQAEADLVKSNSQYEHSLKDYQNNLELNNKKLISDFDLETFKVTKDNAYAAKLNSETNLKKAIANLNYATITSPIDGSVIDVNISEGQTLSTNQNIALFQVAENLSNMEIRALVDENDIGKIKVKQKATFTVEAYPQEIFTGSVREIRLKPSTVQNVVNYTVIIDAVNDKKILLPGMTATIDIVIDEKKDVLYVANSALKFKPTKVMISDVNKLQKDMKNNANRNFQNRQENLPPPPESLSQTSTSMTSNGTDTTTAMDINKKGKPNNVNNQNNNSNTSTIQNTQTAVTTPSESNQQKKNQFQRNQNMVQLWYLDKDNNLKFVMVLTGLSDGQKTEIIVNPNNPIINATEGMNIITGLSTGKPTQQNTNSNNRGGNQFGGPPRMF